MTLQKIFNLVRQGCWERRGRYYWMCGVCRTGLVRRVRLERDRVAVLHCWAHASTANLDSEGHFNAPPGAAAASFGG